MKTIAFILLLVAFPCAAQSPAKFSSTVQLSISCEDESLRNQFNSFLGRELRALGDVTVVDTNPAIVVNLIVVKLSTVKGQPSGFSVAILITSPQRTDFLDLIKDKLDKAWITLIRMNTEGTVYVLDFKLRAGSLDDVKSICQQIIADFDATILDQQRKLWNQLHNQGSK